MLLHAVSTIVLFQAGQEIGPAEPSTIRLQLYRNLEGIEWNNRAKIEGLVDNGEFRIDMDARGLIVKIRGGMGFRKGGWVPKNMQRRPGSLVHDAIAAFFEREKDGCPKTFEYVRDHASFPTTDAYPYTPAPYPIPAEGLNYHPQWWQLFWKPMSTELRRSPDLREILSYPFLPGRLLQLAPMRHSIVGKVADAKVDLLYELFGYRQAGSVELDYRSESGSTHLRESILEPARLRSSKLSHPAPDVDRLYVSEFEPFLADLAFAKELRKAVGDNRTLLFPMLTRLGPVRTVIVKHRGIQRIQFRTLDMEARRFDLMIEKKRGLLAKEERKASVWLDEDWKLVLADCEEPEGFLPIYGLFRIEEKTTSDLDWLYPKWVRSERFKKQGS